MSNQIIVVDPLERLDLLKSLASEVRLRILALLARGGPRNVNEVAAALGLPQSTISSNIQVLVEAGLVQTRAEKGRKGSQKICRSTFSELLIAFKETSPGGGNGTIDVEMPLGLYTRCEVSAPCGLCSGEGIIGLLDVPDTFLDPDRMRAGLLWFTHGFVEYQFPNNAKLSGAVPRALELSMELSSEVPGTSKNWPPSVRRSRLRASSASPCTIKARPTRTLRRCVPRSCSPSTTSAKTWSTRSRRHIAGAARHGKSSARPRTSCTLAVGVLPVGPSWPRSLALWPLCRWSPAFSFRA